jgi:exosortase/archaeosortase family protein
MRGQFGVEAMGMKNRRETTMRGKTAALGQRLGFCAVFLGCLALLALTFDRCELLFGYLYLYPMSQVAKLLLCLVGVPTTLDSSPLDLGICVLTMERIVFHVKEECTGLYALFVYLAALAAYPATVARKLQGVLVGVPAFFAYSSLRLVLLGLIAEVAPDWVRFFHVYLLVLTNVGFMLYLLASWASRGAGGRTEG